MIDKMYPSRSGMDYTNEINRLFPKTTENDVFQTPNTFSTHGFPSPYHQSTTINRSSSSADSTSPESFPDLYRLSTPVQDYRPIFDTPRPTEQPFGIRKRPIIGRKILGNTEQFNTVPTQMTNIFEEDLNSGIWQTEQTLFQQTPPKCTNLFYELFPAENKGFEFQSPIKRTVITSAASPNMAYTPPNMSNMSPSLNMSPSMPNMSPIMSNMSPSLSNMSFTSSPTTSSPNQIRNQPNYLPSANPKCFPARKFYPMKLNDEASSKMCTFCRKNGETPMVYMNHSVRERVGSSQIVTCPILRSHVCSTCGASGDNAHTITYCPVLRSNNNGMPLRSTTITLKNTRVKSNGRRRF